MRQAPELWQLSGLHSWARATVQKGFSLMTATASLLTSLPATNLNSNTVLGQDVLQQITGIPCLR
jgi:hypothetical protein